VLKRSRSVFPTVRRSFFAALVTLAVTMALTFFGEYLNVSTVALIYLLPVIFSSTLWGLGPGLVSGFLAFLAYNYFFLPPYHTFSVHHSQDVVALAVFFVVAVLISQLVGRAKKNLSTAMQREHELARLYEFSVKLEGVDDREGIAKTIASQTLGAFNAKQVEVQVKALAREKAFEVRLPLSGSTQEVKPIAIFPLQTAGRLMGEIRFWRDTGPLNSSEERVFQTFANQGALAIERAALSQERTRAKVLEESDRMKSALLSSVSHELRTPLATIKASVSSLLGGEVEWDTEARKDLMITVDEEIDELNRLVGNLLDMSRIEAGALSPNRQWNDLREIVDSAIYRTRHAIEDYQVEVDIPDDLPLVPVDFMQIERVFINLISNSVKYARSGSRIRFHASVRDSQTLFVQVMNQGPQVPPDHLESIFEKFHRITNAERVTGTGLGLSICKGIIEVHGGRIWGENLPDGFAFDFTLPLSQEGRFPVSIEIESI